MNKENKWGKIKVLYNKYKEAKKDPRKRAGLKLLGYFLFFLIFFLIAGISSNITKTQNKIYSTTTTTTKVYDKYIDKQNNLLENKYNISYLVKYNNIEYKINGILENGVINGYIEAADNIKKITIKNSNIYEINNETEIEINYDFNINYLDVEYIINQIKQTSALIEEKDGIKSYLYEIEKDNIKTNIYVKTSDTNILEIEIKDLENNYLLKFDK